MPSVAPRKKKAVADLRQAGRYTEAETEEWNAASDASDADLDHDDETDAAENECHDGTVSFLRRGEWLVASGVQFSSVQRSGACGGGGCHK